MEGLQLSNSSPRKLDLEVDCLVGADHYGSFMTHEVKLAEYERGPVAICTTLGWVQIAHPSNLSIIHVNFTQSKDPTTEASRPI